MDLLTAIVSVQAGLNLAGLTWLVKTVIDLKTEVKVLQTQMEDNKEDKKQHSLELSKLKDKLEKFLWGE